MMLCTKSISCVAASSTSFEFKRIQAEFFKISISCNFVQKSLLNVAVITIVCIRPEVLTTRITDWNAFRYYYILNIGLVKDES